MSYVAPFVGSQGLTVPAYADILNDNINIYRSIYGQSTYLGTDAADYQWISAVSLKIADVMSGLVLAYNSRSILTAVGSGLDTVAANIGATRKSASFSVVAVTLTGTPGTVINNGIVQDVNGLSWDLPSQVTILAGGNATVNATCEQAGNVNLNPGDISIISTPTAGWVSVTNATSGIAGQPIEPDSQFRARCVLSVALPSQTRFAGTVAAVEQVSGVTRSNFIENPTGAVDSFGTPAHSITVVAEGGTDAAVAQAIYNNRGIGPFTNGTTSVPVNDPATNFQISINFYRPSYVPVFVIVPVHGLAGYTSAVTAAIQAGIVSYLNSLEIGESVIWSEIIGAALTARSNPDLPTFSVQAPLIGTSPSPTGTSDLPMLFFQVAQGLTGNVTVINA